MTTMKLLLLSDSHGRVGSLLEAVDRELPDGAAHLGDVSRVPRPCRRLPGSASVVGVRQLRWLGGAPPPTSWRRRWAG